MDWATRVDVPLSVLAAVCLCITAIYVVVARRHRRAWKAGVMILVALAESMLAHAMQILSADPATRIFWYKMLFLGFAVAPTGFLCLSLHYSGREHWLTPRTGLLLSIIPSVTMALVITNENHGWVWNPASIDPIVRSASFLPVRETGIWYWVLATYSYLVLTGGCLLFGQMFIRARKIYGWRAGGFGIAAAFAGFSNVLDVFHVSPLPPFVATELGLAGGVATVALLFSVFQRRDVLSVTRGAMINSITDSILVVDAEGQIVDLNPAAEELVGKKASQTIGQPLEQVWPELKTKCDSFTQGSGEISLPRENKQFTFDMRISLIQDWQSRLVSRVIVLRDITERERADEELRHRNAELKALRQMGLELTAELDLTKLLGSIVQRAVILTESVTSSCYLYQPDRNVLERAVTVGTFLVQSQSTRKRGEGLIGKVWETGTPIVVNDYRQWNGRRTVYDAEPSRAVIGVPIRWGEEFLGVLNVVADPPRIFHPADAELLGLFADHAAMAIKNATLHEQVSASEERYALAARGANDGLWDWNLDTHQIYYSPRWKAMIGCTENEVGNTPEEWFKRVQPEDLGKLKADLASHFDGRTAHFENEHRILSSEGTYRWVLSRGVAVRNKDGQVHRIAGSQTDITQRKQAEARLLYGALHDALTGLPNRVLFMDRLDQAIKVGKRRRSSLAAMLFLDLDRFKVVNDSLGHLMGDELLIAVARRLEACLRPGDTVARFGGDEFGILLDDISDAVDASRAAERVQNELTSPFRLNGHKLSLSASIGIAFMYPDTLKGRLYEQPEEVLRDADIAMYRAKALGKARHEVFDASMHARAVELMCLEDDLRRALEQQEFRLHYQPIISLSTGEITGVEALVRWHHPERGLIQPAEFIPVAEETGLIVPLGEWVLRTACEQVQSWRTAGHSRLQTAVNFSARQFQDSDLSGLVQRILQETGLPPPALQLEITESTAMKDVTQSVQILDELDAVGVQVSIDDFGNSYSALGNLKRFPFKILKIDQSFLQDVTRDPNNAAITTAIIVMAHSLELKVVAEGVETEDQLRFLRAQQCDEAQGYLFSRPVSAQEIARLIGTEGKALAPVSMSPSLNLVGS